jgi:hypothetical protein
MASRSCLPSCLRVRWRFLGHAHVPPWAPPYFFSTYVPVASSLRPILTSVAVSVSVSSASSAFSSGRLIDRRVPWQATLLDIIGCIVSQDTQVSAGRIRVAAVVLLAAGEAASRQRARGTPVLRARTRAQPDRQRRALTALLDARVERGLRRVPARPAVACVVQDSGYEDQEGGRDVGHGERACGVPFLAPDCTGVRVLACASPPDRWSDRPPALTTLASAPAP